MLRPELFEAFSKFKAGEAASWAEYRPEPYLKFCGNDYPYHVDPVPVGPRRDALNKVLRGGVTLQEMREASARLERNGAYYSYETLEWMEVSCAYAKQGAESAIRNGRLGIHEYVYAAGEHGRLASDLRALSPERLQRLVELAPADTRNYLGIMLPDVKPLIPINNRTRAILLAQLKKGHLGEELEQAYPLRR